MKERAGLDAIEAVILGLVQGLTEFFPVSSSGHLAMMQALFGGRESVGLLFEVGVHVATLFAIAFFYRARIAELARGCLAGEAEALAYAGKLAVATLPVVVVGLFGREVIEDQFSQPARAGSALLVTGVIVMSTRWTGPRAKKTDLSWGAAFLIGVAQAFAILPGISRSGSTVAAALALGIAPRVAAEFAFLLGIVAITGAAALMLPDLQQAAPGTLGDLALGGGAAFVSGLVAIGLFVRMLDRQTFHHWAWYCWGAGASFLWWTLGGWPG